MTSHRSIKEPNAGANQRLPGLLDTLRAALQTAVGELDLPLEAQQVQALAADIERAVCREHGGTSPYIPALSGIDKHNRNHAIRCDYDQGASLAELACHYHLTESRIRQILVARRGLSHD